MIFISLSLQGCFPVGGPLFLFELTFPFNIYHPGPLKCCFSAEAACKLFVAAAIWEVCCLQCLIPHLNQLTLSFHLCTRPLHHTTCFWGAGVYLASCLYLLHVWPGGVFPVCCRTSVSSVLWVPKERRTTACCYVWVKGWYWLQWHCLHP